jgi:VCBS repeat-containing protein
MESTRVPVAVIVVMGVIVAAILAIIIWFATAGLRSGQPIAETTPTPSPTASSSPAPSSTPTPTATPTPGPTQPPVANPPANPPANNPPATNPPATPDTTAPGLITALNGTPSSHAVVLSWTNPGDADYASAVIRRAAGATPPSSATDGTAVAITAAPATSATDSNLATGVYSYAVFARDAAGNVSGAATATFTLPVALAFGTTDLDGTATQAALGQTITDTGDLAFTAFDAPDADDNRTVTATRLTPGSVGTLDVVENPGTVVWTFSADDDLRYLDAGETLALSWRVTITEGPDSIQRDVTIVVTGVDDPLVVPTIVPPAIIARDTATFSLPTDAFVDPDTGLRPAVTLTGPLGATPEPWLTYDDATGEFSAAPLLADAGPHTFELRAVSGGNIYVASFSFPVTARPNLSPVPHDDDVTIDMRSQLSVTANLLDNDTDDGEYEPLQAIPESGNWYLTSNTTSPAGTYTIDDAALLTLNAYSGNTGPLAELAEGETADAVLDYQVEDGSFSAAATINIQVTGRNEPPSPIQVTDNSRTVTRGETNTIDIDSTIWSDVDGDVLDFVGTSPVPWATWNATTFQWTVTPPLDYVPDSLSLSIDILDPFGGASTLELEVAVIDPLPLEFVSTDLDGGVTQVLPFDGTILSDSGELEFSGDDALTHTATAQPFSVTSLGTLTATLTEPVGSTPGTVTWTYTVPNESIRSLGATQTRTEKFRVTIGDGTDSIHADVIVVAHGTNDQPNWTAEQGVDPITSGQTTTFQVSDAWISDPDDEPIDYTLVDAPVWLTLDGDGTFTASPPISVSGNVTFTLRATDAAGATAANGNVAGDATQNQFVIVVNQPPATVANDDTEAWDLRFTENTFEADLTANDTAGGPVTAVPESGDFFLVGNPRVAGTYSIAADGTLTLTTAPIRNTALDPDDPNYFSPISLLGDGEIAQIALDYVATDGTTTDGASIDIAITGELDPVFQVRPLIGPNNVTVGYNAPPTLFDAGKTFDSPDPFNCVQAVIRCTATDNGGPVTNVPPGSGAADWFVYQWYATSSSGIVSTDPAFHIIPGGGASVPTVSVLNSEWGFESAVSISITARPIDGRAPVTTEINFFVSDVEETHPADAVNDTVAFDLRAGDWLDPDSATKDLLANDSNAGSAVAATGTWSLDGDDDPAGTFSIAANGTLTLDDGTDDFGPLQRLAPDETAVAHLDYTAVSPDGNDTATVTINVTGAADPLYRVGELQGPDGATVDRSSPGSSTFDASAMFTGPDPDLNYVLTWFGESDSLNPLPEIPALLPGSNVSSFSVANSAWTVDGYTITVIAIPDLGRPVVNGDTDSVHFTTTDSGGEPPPVANDDQFAWDLRTSPQNVDITGNVLVNDTPNDQFTATPAIGDFTIEGQTQVAGSYVLYPDGTITLTAAPIRPGVANDDIDPLPSGGLDPDDPNYYSPLSKLSPGQTATIKIPYETTTTGGADTAYAIFTVTGRLDPVYQVRDLVGPNNVTIDFGDPVPTRFDASRIFSSPDPFTCGNPSNCNPDNLNPNPTGPLPPGSPPATLYVQYSWEATSTSSVSPDPAFHDNANVPWVIVPNNVWGFDSQVTVKISGLPGDGRAVPTDEISFTVGEIGDLISIQNDSGAWDLRDDADSFSMNVLANDTPGATATAFSGPFSLVGDTRTAGTYALAADGTLTLTPAPVIPDPAVDPDDPAYFSPLSLLNPGEEATIDLGYSAAAGAYSGSATVTITVTGNLNEVYQVRPLVGPDQVVLDYNDPNPTLFDATNTFRSPDPFQCMTPMTDACADLPDDPSQLSYIQFSWQAQSTVNVPADPAWISGANVKTVSVMNTEWGFNSGCQVTITAITSDGRPSRSTTIIFAVADGGASLMARGYDELAEPELAEPEPDPTPTPSPEPSRVEPVETSTPEPEPTVEPTPLPTTEPTTEPEPAPTQEPSTYGRSINRGA